MLMDFRHPNWGGFYMSLAERVTEDLICDGTLTDALKLLTLYGADVDATVEYWASFGIECDCEVVLNAPTNAEEEEERSRYGGL